MGNPNITMGFATHQRWRYDPETMVAIGWLISGGLYGVIKNGFTDRRWSQFYRNAHEIQGNSKIFCVIERIWPHNPHGLSSFHLIYALMAMIRVRIPNSRNGLAQIKVFRRFFEANFSAEVVLFCHGNVTAMPQILRGSAPADPITGRDHRIHGISWVPTTSTFQIALIQWNSLATSGHQFNFFEKDQETSAISSILHRFSWLAMGPRGHRFQASSCPARTSWSRSWSATPRVGPTGAWWSPSRRVRRVRRVRRPSRDGSRTGGFHRKMPIGCRTEMGNDGMGIFDDGNGC